MKPDITESAPTPLVPDVSAKLLRHVLVCLDQSPLAEAVLGHALTIASACGAAVTVLHVLEPPTHPRSEPPDPLEWEVNRLEAGGYLRTVADRARPDSRVPLATELAEGDPVVQIRRWVDDHDIDLVVLCTHGVRGHTEWSLASTARKLVEVLRCSLLVVPGAFASTAPALSYARVLVPLDGSKWSESVLPVAARLAAQHGAELLLVHAVVKPELFAFGPLTPEDLELEQRILERNERGARDYLEHVRAQLSAMGLNVRTIVERDGSVRTALLRVVGREQPDLLLFSASGTSGRSDGPCGTVASHLLAHTAKPALMLRPPCEHASGSKTKHRAQAAPRLPTQASP